MFRLRPVLVMVLAASAVMNAVTYVGLINSLFGHNDFRLYYAGAQVGLQYGWSHIYDARLDQAVVAAMQPKGPWYALLTPAPIAWAVAPLTRLGYPSAYWVWVTLSVAALAVAAWYARPRRYSTALYLTWWAALGPLWFSAFEGQVTILVAAAVLAGWQLLERRRDFLGGLVLSATLFKPHLVLLLPLALLVAGRIRALVGFVTAAAVAGIGMLLTLRPDGIRSYLAMLLVAQPEGNTAETLRTAFGAGPSVVLVQALAVAIVIVVALHARRTRSAWPAVVSALLGSFLLATYLHPQDYLMLDAAGAIMLAAGSIGAGILTAAATAVLSTPLSPLTSSQVILHGPSRTDPMIAAWLLFAIGILAFLGLQALKQIGPSSRVVSVNAQVAGPEPPRS